MYSVYAAESVLCTPCQIDFFFVFLDDKQEIQLLWANESIGRETEKENGCIK